MGLGKMFRARTAPDSELRTAGQTFDVLLRRADSEGWSPAYRYQGGMRIPGAWRCAVLLSDLLGQVPWEAYRDYGGNPVEMLSPRPLLLDQPNPPDTRMTTFSSWALDLIWEGNAIGIVAARNAQGWPTAAYAVPAQMVGVRRVTPWVWSNLPIGAIEYQVGTMTFGSDDIIHIKGPCEPGALRGMGVLEAHMDTLHLAESLDRQAENVARGDGVPTGILKSSNPDLTPEEAQDLKRAWRNAQAERSVAVLNPSTDFQPLAWNPKDLQLIEARKFSLHQLALIFGLPLSMLGVETSNRTYRNDDTESINIIKFALSGHLARFEQTLSLHLPRGTEAKADVSAISLADTLTRFKAYQIGIETGFMQENEARAKERWRPLTPAELKPPTPEPAQPPIRVPAMLGTQPPELPGGSEQQ